MLGVFKFGPRVEEVVDFTTPEGDEVSLIVGATFAGTETFATEVVPLVIEVISEELEDVAPLKVPLTLFTIVPPQLLLLLPFVLEASMLVCLKG